MLPFLIKYSYFVYIHFKTIHGDNCDSENVHVNQFDSPVTVSTDMLL